MTSGKQLIFGAFRLDLVNECLWRGEHAIALAPKEFAVLRYLIHNPGRLVTKEELFEAVWPVPAYSPDFNPIEECISKIKQILRSLKARTKRKLYNALAKAIEKVTDQDILGWFKHCGYVFSLN